MKLIEFVSKNPPIGYRKLDAYLKSTYTKYKDLMEKYSYAEFSEDLGLGHGNVSWLLINGKRKFTVYTSNKIAEALQFEGAVLDYWNTLVEYTHSKSAKDREHMLQVMVDITRKMTSNEKDGQVLDFYNNWFNPLLFEAIEIEEIAANPKRIEELFFPDMSHAQIKRGLELLEKMDLIAQDRDTGEYYKKSENFKTSGRVPGIGIIRFHQKMADLSKEALEKIPVTDREMGSITAAVSEQGFEHIKDEIRRMRRYLLYLCNEYKGGERLVQVNLQSFSINKK